MKLGNYKSVADGVDELNDVIYQMHYEYDHAGIVSRLIGVRNRLKKLETRGRK